jgi:hypothetical protein
MTVQELISILQKHDPWRVVVDGEGLELRVGDVLAVQLHKVPGTPAWGDQGAARYELCDEGSIEGLSIG